MKESCKGELTIVWEADLQGERRLLKTNIMLESMSSITKEFLGNAVYTTIIDVEQTTTKNLIREKAEAAELAKNQEALAAVTSEPNEPAALTDEAKPTDEIELTEEELEAATSPATSQLELELKEPTVDDLKAKMQQ
mgnify:CR=1 FL=1